MSEQFVALLEKFVSDVSRKDDCGASRAALESFVRDNLLRPVAVVREEAVDDTGAVSQFARQPRARKGVK